MTHWHVANENPGRGVMAHVFMFVNNSVKDAWMADTAAETSWTENDWKTEEVEILIHHYENESMLWDVRHSDNSRKEVRQKALVKTQEVLQNKVTSVFYHFLRE